MINLKCFQMWKPYCCIFLGLLFITSCSGQGNKEIRKLKVESSISTDTIDEPTWVDPLFFNEGQFCQHLREIFHDSKGNLWLGTNVYGIMRYDGSSFQDFKDLDGVGVGRVTGILEDKAGNIWFGTSSGLLKYDGVSYIRYSEKEGLLNNEIWSLLIDKNGLIWIGTNTGLCSYDGNKFEAVSIPRAKVKEVNTIYSEDRINGLAQDEEGNLWLGTDGFGICKYDGKEFATFTMTDGICDNTISELMIDSKNNLWIGTYWGGVSKFDGQKFINFTKEGMVSGAEVGAFFEDRNGDVWFAAENNGVYKHNGKSFVNYGEENGLNTNGILSIYRDKENRFWFGGWGGLYRYDGTSFNIVSREGPWSK